MCGKQSYSKFLIKCRLKTFNAEISVDGSNTARVSGEETVGVLITFD